MRLFGVSLVPRNGARVVRKRSHRRLMNENFVNIKVDREERPDLDQIYMKRRPNDDRPGRMANDHVPHARLCAFLWWNLFSSERPL